MKHVFIQITQVRAHYFKLFNRLQSTQDEKVRFIKGNELIRLLVNSHAHADHINVFFYYKDFVIKF